MTGSRDNSMHRSKGALKFRTMSFCPAALVRQTKARRGEIPGNEFLPDRAEAATEGRSR